MAATREQVFEALRVQLQTLYPATLTSSVSRVWKHWDAVSPSTDQPALFVCETPESSSQDKGSPPIRTMTADLVLYANRGALPDTVMSSVLNPILDAIEVALKPDPVTGFNSLGGLVSHCWIVRDDIYEGTFGDQAVVIIPVEIMMMDFAGAPNKTYVFDAGSLYANPTIAQGGGTAPSPAPIKFANLKGVTIEASAEMTFQGSQLEYPIAAARGVTRVRVTAAIGAFDGLVVDQVFFGRNRQAGASLMDVDRAYTIPATPAYTVTVAPPGGGTFVEDFGVVRALDGSALVRVSGAPATGQYSVAGAVYTFNAAQAGAGIALSYLYATTTGSKIVLDNAFKGIAPSFRAVLQGGYNGRKVTWILSNCITTRFAVPTLKEQFSVMSFEFEAIADSNGNLGTLSIG